MEVWKHVLNLRLHNIANTRRFLKILDEEVEGQKNQLGGHTKTLANTFLWQEDIVRSTISWKKNVPSL